jgi:hypothetical protein
VQVPLALVDVMGQQAWPALPQTHDLAEQVP